MLSRTTFHVLLTEEYVAAANTGRPFSREGLRTVCGADFTSKGAATEDSPFADSKDVNEFLKKIRDEQVGAYNSRPRYIAEEAEREKKLRREYAARVLPELVQNAHDAATDHPIGKYGVGFKAVLNVSDGPHIHSGKLHCRFDRMLAHEELSGAGLLEGEESNVPLLRLPFSASDDDEPKPVRDLIKDYDTVVVLPFFGEEGKEGREHLLEEWDNCVQDVTLPLFLPAIEKIIFERIDGKERSKRVWHRRSKDSFVEIFAEDNPDAPARWKLYSSEEASVAIRVDEDDIPFPEEQHPKFRVYFRTEERNPIPILMHANLPLKEGRSNVLKDDPDSRTEVEAKVRDLARLVRAALANVRDPGRLLDLLRPRPLEQMEGVEKRLWEGIKTEVTRLRIPGTRRVTLGQIRLRPKNQGTAWWFDCQVWNEFKTLLSRFRKGKLTGLSFLPPGIDTEEREETILALNPHARLSIEELRGLPLLPVEGDKEPIAPGRTNTFFPSEASDAVATAGNRSPLPRRSPK